MKWGWPFGMKPGEREGRVDVAEGGGFVTYVASTCYAVFRLEASQYCLHGFVIFRRSCAVNEHDVRTFSVLSVLAIVSSTSYTPMSGSNIIPGSTTPPVSIRAENNTSQTWFLSITSRIARTLLPNSGLNLLPGPNNRSPIRSNRPHFRLFQSTSSYLSAALRRIRHIVQRRVVSRIKMSTTTVAQSLWRVFDGVVLLGMGSGYVTRFEEFAAVSEGEGCEPLIREWRDEQQEEWSRLSTTVRPRLSSYQMLSMG